MYYIVLPSLREYYQTNDEGQRVPCKNRRLADRYDLDHANRVALRVGGVAVDERTGGYASDRKGATVVEYAVILAVICVAVFFSVRAIGEAINQVSERLVPVQVK